MTLTNFLRHGTLPKLFVVPNPNQGSALISASETLGEASVEIIDMLGRIHDKINISLKKEEPAKLEFDDLRSGSYYLRVRTQESQYQIPIAIVR